MKIGIDYDFLNKGSNSVNRGVGRYTQQQIREVIKIDTDNEYKIYIPNNSDCNLILPEIRSAKNVQIKPYHFDHYTDDVIEENQLIEYSSRFQDFIYSENIDLFHFTVPYFLGLLPIQFTVCPMVANYFDAIPLIFPSIYLSNLKIQKEYLYSTHLCNESSRLIAISNSAKWDARLYLGYPEVRIDVAYPIPDPHFKILTKEKMLSILSGLRKRVNLPEKYFLNVTGFHYTKNHSTLLHAYKNLPDSIRKEIGLVFVCEMSEHQKSVLQNELIDLGINQNIIFAGFVSDEELVALYNSATALIHPSIYEGFGLPVVEAMCCGTPVITTTTSSLPEVAGNAAILIDPLNTGGFTDAMESIYSDKNLREEMILNGLEQCKIFSPKQLGESTLTSYRKAIHHNTDPNKEKLNIAMWAPLPPLQTGIATYCSDLIIEFGKKAEIELFIDKGYMPEFSLLENFNIHFYESFDRRNRQVNFDIIIYQMGASEFHRYMLNAISEFPGIIDLHDLTFSDFYLAKYNSSENEGIKILAEIEGISVINDFHDYLQNKKNGNLLDFSHNFMMIKSLVDESKAVLAHYPLASNIIVEKSPNAKIFTSLLSVTDPWIDFPPDQIIFRKLQLGYSKKDFIIGIFGIVHELKRNREAIIAFANIRAKNPSAKLIVVGRVLSIDYENKLKDLIIEYGIQEAVLFTGNVSDELYHRYMSICSLVMNLRDPSRKQMSLSLIQALANGIPVILSDIPEWGFLPSNCCVRVKPDEQEIGLLSNSIRKFIAQPNYCKEMGQHARDYYLKFCNTRKIADHYLEIVKDVIADGENK